ncbi:hypothetical protein IEO21_08807 [Rhodonia placenta]|uniref:F-box domain-containing protein n=1 Tax=Rhodonia placenta TaxID=104341 RepID=A0A8H7NVK1_9APHY|nr:hypothetical protein IEO21_08807 [Postia placenta]
MVAFLDLPLELLPLIIQHLVRPSHIAAVCLVNRTFYDFMISHLYKRVFVYAWHKEAKLRVIKLFTTLAEHPHLAQHVDQLEIRDFPKALNAADYETVENTCLVGIRNCRNLRVCTWTRDGSLTTNILEALQQCPALQELEINGHNEGNYKPWLLTKFHNLRRISLIMPSASVIETLPTWMQHTGITLRHLSLICKTGTVVNDGLLESLVPFLPNLEHLYFVNCVKVTDRGLVALLSQNVIGLRGLGLEGVSPNFDMREFSQTCTRSGTMNRLQSITLTVSAHLSPTWEVDVVELLKPAPLERFHVSTTGGIVGNTLNDAFCAQIVDIHGSRLRRFSVHRMRMSVAAIEDICRRCVQLEQLFIVVDQHKLEAIGPALALARNLRSVHINRPLDLGSEDIPVLARERILEIVKQCGPNLRQFGYNTRVLQVERVVQSVGVDVRLGSYENPEVPEQFLVVRT